MVRSSSAWSSRPDPTAINLSRMLSRLQHILTSADPAAESKLRSSRYEREKVGSNISYARTLLLRLEQDALSITVARKKQETQTDLVRKREALDRLSERLLDLENSGEDEEFNEEDGDTEEEDLLGEDTPGEGDTTDELSSHNDNDTPPRSASLVDSTRSPSDEDDEPSNSIPQRNEDVQEWQSESAAQSSTLRSRNARAELFAGQSSSTTGMSTGTSEALLTHNRTEQESLTNSLLSMAQALRASSLSFASSLEDEKAILDRASEGLGKNELGMEAAQRRMGHLRTMTEGKGWWGRMLMYAYIAGLMVLALVIVFVLPKLRF